MRVQPVPAAALLALLGACTEYEINEKEQPSETGLLDSAPPEDSTPPEDSPPVETCDGEDDDGDGLIDEDWGDADGDGVADCRDAEGCDGLDNDGDGLVDEDYDDTDADGTADCQDAEECDGLDNDGDGLVDEGYDADADDTPDCQDAEECDGLDNDGDGLVDEGFADTDADLTPDCLDVEECDGLDNDGDSETDEGFDTDADGIIDCFESTYSVTVLLSADDEWEGWADGASIGGESGWSTTETVSLTWDSGPHALAIHAWDTGAAIAGFIAAVQVEGVDTWLTGTDTWRYTTSSPDSAWSSAGFDDSSWSAASLCSSSEVSAYWGGEPSAVLATGAQWVWIGRCTGLGQGWFRLEIELP